MYGTKQVSPRFDHLAPDHSQIRELLSLARGSVVHVTLPVGGVSQAVAHKTIEEIWYFIGGHGRMWRRQEGQEEEVDVSPGTCVSIPTGTHFQFRTTGDRPLEFICMTMPPWPGSDEAYEVPNYWPVE
jgi:mannose-6-phosphate isomerase-like protein (cupin superfamily)